MHIEILIFSFNLWQWQDKREKIYTSQLFEMAEKRHFVIETHIERPFHDKGIEQQGEPHHHTSQWVTDRSGTWRKECPPPLSPSSGSFWQQAGGMGEMGRGLNERQGSGKWYRDANIKLFVLGMSWLDELSSSRFVHTPLHESIPHPVPFYIL